MLHEVTNAQYTEFLNAVDPTGANALGLYNFGMSFANGGINFQGGAANGSKYQVRSGRDNNPVILVSFFDAMRFTNRLENGQGSGSTESGVYSIGNGLNETRNPSATYFIPSENEWYKAAYHKNDGVTANYWDYPTATDTAPFSDQPPGSGAPTQSNTANFYRDDFVATGAVARPCSYLPHQEKDVRTDRPFATPGSPSNLDASLPRAISDFS